MKSEFEALIDDLAALQAMRTTQTPSRDTAARAARQAHESARNRRLQQMQQQPRRLMKSAVPNYTPDWDGLASRQEQIAADLERSRIDAQKDAIRAHLATLRQAAQAGRLSSFEAAKYDALVGQAARMGLQP